MPLLWVNGQLRTLPARPGTSYYADVNSSGTVLRTAWDEQYRGHAWLYRNGRYIEVDVVPVDRAEHDLLAHADLVVVGGPTHAHGMSRAGTREAAATEARKADSQLTLDPDAEGPGLREWLAALPP